ncbi:MAG: DUF4105 domain-containing protein [Myxococcota bacterium]
MTQRYNTAATWGAVMVGLFTLLATAPAHADWVDQGVLAQPIPSSLPQPERIEFHTMGVGDDIFSLFGHSALCVIDSQTPTGRCYNYGTSDFRNPVWLTWEVLRGRAPFWVSRMSKPMMLRVYRRQDRTEYIQVLPLTDEEERRLSMLLQHEALPENKHYVYNHFFDNCATRLRDHIDTATRGRLSAGAHDELLSITFRDYVRQGLAMQPALLTLTEFMLGRSLDRQVTLWEAMFLPQVMRQEVQKRFGVEPTIVYTRQKDDGSPDPNRGWQILLGIALLALALTTTTALVSSGEQRPLSTRAGRVRRLGLVVAGLLLGVPALMIGLMIVLSSLPEFRYNEAMLVFLPTDLMLIGLSGVRLRRYLQIRVGWLAVVTVLTAVGLLSQPLWAPIALAAGCLIPLAWAEHQRTHTAGGSTTLNDTDDAT